MELGWRKNKVVISSIKNTFDMKQTQKDNLQVPDFKTELLGNNLPANYALFYPCCGNDIFDAISYFHSIVDTFFFCDTNRCVINSVTHRQIKEILPDFDLVKSFEEYIWKTNERPNRREDIEPPLYQKTSKKLTQIWRNEKKNKDISIIRVVGDGYEIFTNDGLLKKIAIFFYRGDSYSEGGSDVRWLETKNDESLHGGRGKHFDIVLQKITNKGLIVTDGSNHGKEFHFFRQYCNSINRIGREFVDKVTKDGYTFNCVGKITPRYGPTLVWQIETETDLREDVSR